MKHLTSTEFNLHRKLERKTYLICCCTRGGMGPDRVATLTVQTLNWEHLEIATAPLFHRDRLSGNYRSHVRCERDSELLSKQRSLLWSERDGNKGQVALSRLQMGSSPAIQNYKSFFCWPHSFTLITLSEKEPNEQDGN